MQRLTQIWTKREALWLGLAGLVAFVAVWELVSQAELADSLTISRPSWLPEAFMALARTGAIRADITASMTEFIWGYGMAVVIGVSIGLIAGWYRRVEYAIEPLFWFLYNSPKIAFFPLFILWLGIGQPTIIALTFLYAFFPIYVNAFTGMKNVSPLLINCARSFGASTPAILVKIALPASTPLIIAGLRLGVGRAFIGVVVGELFGGQAGLGFRMAFSAGRLRTTDYFVALVITALFGVVLTQLLRWLERRTANWRAA